MKTKIAKAAKAAQSAKSVPRLIDNFIERAQSAQNGVFVCSSIVPPT